MITKEQALTAHEFHFGTCTRVIGPNGGIKEHTEHWRRNGETQTWVRRPDDFRVPIKYGLKSYSQIYASDAPQFHTAADCPLNDPAYVTKDNRKQVA
jgi:hypothetical protein